MGTFANVIAVFLLLALSTVSCGTNQSRHRDIYVLLLSLGCGGWLNLYFIHIDSIALNCSGSYATVSQSYPCQISINTTQQNFTLKVTFGDTSNKSSSVNITG
jgi:hypothetical protein